MDECWVAFVLLLGASSFFGEFTRIQIGHMAIGLLHLVQHLDTGEGGKEVPLARPRYAPGRGQAWLG